MNKHVIILTKYFIPYTSAPGGFLRVLKMADFFRSRGVAVEVVSSRGKNHGAFGYNEAVSRFKTTYISTGFSSGTDSRGQDSDRGGGSSACKLIIFLTFFVRTLWYLSSEITKGRGRNIIVSSPPHQLQLIGLLLKLRFGRRLNWIVDYRDSWNLRNLAFVAKPSLGKRISMAAEKLVLTKCDRFVFVSTPMLEKVNRFFGDKASKATLVMNGFDAEMGNASQTPPAQNALATIGYFGTFSDQSGSRKTPVPLLRAVAECKTKFQLMFYGEGQLDFEWRERLGSQLQVNAMVPHADAIEIMRRMHLLLIVSTEGAGGEEVVTGKLFDYLLAERPILLIGREDSEAARIIRDEGVGYIADFREDERIQACLEQIASDLRTGSLPNYRSEKLRHLSRQHQYSKLLPIIH